MKIARIITVGMLIIALAYAGYAQDTPPSQPKKESPVKVKKKFWDKVSIGGYFGVQFGTLTSINVSPLAIYEVTPQFYTGVGFTYLYYRDKYYGYSSSGYGGNLLARYHVWKDIFVQAEYDPLYLIDYYIYPDGSGGWAKGSKYYTWVHDILIGAGYRAWLGGRAFATLAIFYNLNETSYSRERNPIIRVSFGVGL
jgi:hypothetical protein